MTNRTIALIQAVCISLLLAVVPRTAAPQEQKEPAAQQQPEQSVQPAQQPTGSPNAPVEENAKSPAAAEKTPEAPTVAPPKEEISEYTIKQGDTLWDISNNLFRDPFLWPFIWKANPSIANPDLIYAGNKLMIPSLTPIERAMEAPKKQLVEKLAPEERPAEEAEPKPLGGIASARATRPKPVQPAPEEEAAAEGSKLILPEAAPMPIIDKYSMLSAGFVNNTESTDSIVSGEVHERTTLGYDDVVYVKFGSPQNVNIGDKFLIYTPLDSVKHPVTGERFGRLIRGLGILQITAKDPSADVLTARITLSFSEIPVGSLVTPYQEPMLVYQPAEKRSKDIAGYIIEVTDTRTINGQLDIVYLDKGRADGVDAGDRFLVYREPAKSGFPRRLIGEVQVFLVKDRTSTAVVQKSTVFLERGNAVNYEK
jgi:hypothetical protein